MPYVRSGIDYVSPRVRRRYRDMRKMPAPRRQEDRDERRARSQLAPRSGQVLLVVHINNKAPRGASLAAPQTRR